MKDKEIRRKFIVYNKVTGERTQVESIQELLGITGLSEKDIPFRTYKCEVGNFQITDLKVGD